MWQDRDPLLLEILLVVFLGAVKRTGGLNLGDDGPPENPFFSKSRLGFAGLLLLLRVVEEDRGTVLRAEVRPLGGSRWLGSWLFQKVASSSR